MPEYEIQDAATKIENIQPPKPNMPQEKSKKKNIIIITAVILTFAALIFAFFRIYPRLFTAPGDYSYGVELYMKNHKIGTSLREASDKYGKDLLVDKIVLDNVAESIYENYVLQFSRDNPDERKNMERLSCKVYYDSTFSDTDHPYIFCTLYFNNDEWRPYKSFFEQSCTALNTETFNGVEIQYGEYSQTINGVSSYEAQAFFTYNNIKYSIKGKTLELVTNTVKQMLS